MQPPMAFTLTAHGAKMPAIGYGTMELPQRGPELVAYAIKSGYRLIDTARKYGTEEKVGEGIRLSGIARSELWVTTKVTELDAREADFLRSAEASLKALQLDYVDCCWCTGRSQRCRSPKRSAHSPRPSGAGSRAISVCRISPSPCSTRQCGSAPSR